MAITLAYNPDVGGGDIAFTGGRIATGNALQTLVYTSLFTDARASQAERPGPGQDRRGYWGDVFLPVGHSHGSKLWLLRPGKIHANTVHQVEDYTRQALAWLVDEGHARAITVTAERRGVDAIAVHIVVTDTHGNSQTITASL